MDIWLKAISGDEDFKMYNCVNIQLSDAGPMGLLSLIILWMFDAFFYCLNSCLDEMLEISLKIFTITLLSFTPTAHISLKVPFNVLH